MTTPLLPQAFWFRLSVPCRRIDGLPRVQPKGRLLDLPGECALPELARLDGKTPWAHVRVAWNPGGLAVQVEASGTKGPGPPGDLPEGMDGVQLWIDTRDTRNVSRATRFCHRFLARAVVTGESRSALGVEVTQRPISRAVADAPTCRPESIASRAERVRNGWRLELYFPAGVLHGFDPETNRRLGFAYQVTDPALDDQFLGVGREFPLGENPSLWSTLELTEVIERQDGA